MTQDELERLLSPPEPDQVPVKREPYKPIPEEMLEGFVFSLHGLTPRQKEIFEQLRQAHIRGVREVEDAIQAAERSGDWASLRHRSLPHTVSIHRMFGWRAGTERAHLWDIAERRPDLLFGANTGRTYRNRRRSMDSIGVAFPVLKSWRTPRDEMTEGSDEWLEALERTLRAEHVDALRADSDIQLNVYKADGSMHYWDSNGSYRWNDGRDYSLHRRYKVSFSIGDVASPQDVLAILDHLRELQVFCKRPPDTRDPSAEEPTSAIEDVEDEVA